MAASWVDVGFGMRTVARTCAPFGESSDRIGALDVLLREARILLAEATVVFVTSTGTPGSAPDVLAVRHVHADVGSRSTERWRGGVTDA